MYFLLGVSLSLALLLMVNLLVAVLASGIWGIVRPHTGGFSAGVRGQIIFGLRILPVAAALIFVSVFLVPSYLLHEPPSSGEVVSSKLAFLALVSSFAISIALFRVFRTWRSTHLLAADWLRGSVRVELNEVSVPIYKIKHRFPVIAVLGIFRPRMFVAEQVLELIDANEFAAAIAHEYGHLQANDNFKRTLLRVCRDMLILPVGEALDRAWAENSELVADDYAASRGRSIALDLASALVKIARIVEPGTEPAMPAGAYLLSEHELDITSRVRRLLVVSEAVDPAKRKAVMCISPLTALSAAVFGILVILPFVEGRLLTSTHDVLERFVAILR